MDLLSHLELALQRQQAYYQTNNFEVRHLKALLTYIVEETVEINRELTEGSDRYKTFKAERPVNKAELEAEIADLLLHAFNTAAVAQSIYGLNIELALNKKIIYNTTRTDHSAPFAVKN